MARFMYGRNGADQLNVALIWACLLLELIAMLVSRGWALGGAVLYYASLAAWGWVLFRTFSKNLTRRRAENQRWLTVWGRVRSAGSGARARRADKAHKYFTCKQCKAICRVPAGQGKIVITCPKCGAEIHGKS
jgi:hypothetical protein